MTDQEVLATFMEPRPELPDCYSHLMQSPQLWWILGPIMHGGMAWYPRPLDLDACREIEARLISLGHRDAVANAITFQLWSGGTDETAVGSLAAWHATAEQKVKALAQVLRPIVEAQTNA